jgi:hypothetical protein
MATKTTNTKTTKATAKTKAMKSSPQTAKPNVESEKKLGALSAAAKVLSESDLSLNCQELVEKMAAKGLWSSPGGATPHATLHAAISREIKVKGKESRFAKTGPGKFTCNS